MSELTFEKDNRSMSVTLTHATPTLSKSEEPDNNDFQIRFVSDNKSDSVVVTLTASKLMSLGLQCAEHIPSVLPAFTAATIEEAYRIPARVIKELKDQSIQNLMRECQSETLVDFLWYMKDGDLIKQIMRNISQSAGESLMDDLNARWRGKNPDTVLEINAQHGRQAVQDIMKTIQDLITEGTIEDVIGDQS